ncbi:MAG: twin-arginine translocase TatA/TatE family subunit [Cellvibrionaceae bacterium]|nr:twin-arginine translocase TatA/TatE family subunit [Cellvibrionaceae bacterium]
MGISGIGIGPLLVILAIVILLFGTKKLRGMGSDLGGALKGFKKALNEEESATKTTSATTSATTPTEPLEKKETDTK